MSEHPEHPNCKCIIELGQHIDSMIEAAKAFDKLLKELKMTTYAAILCPKCQGSWMTDFLPTALELLEWVNNFGAFKKFKCIHCRHEFERWEIVEEIEAALDE